MTDSTPRFSIRQNLETMLGSLSFSLAEQTTQVQNLRDRLAAAEAEIQHLRETNTALAHALSQAQAQSPNSAATYSAPIYPPQPEPDVP